MKYTALFILLFGLGVAALNFQACKREPVYFGVLDPDILDTTQTGGGGGGGGGGSVGTPCDPNVVYFDQQVLPILRSNCAKAGCHDAASHEEGVILDSYSNVRNTGKIKLNDPTQSEIYEVITETDPDKIMPPPPNLPLNAQQKALILQWIQQGAKDLHCDAECDTTNVRFSTTIMPLIATRCQGCHSGAAPSGGFRLTNFTEVKAKVTDGRLLGSINHAPGFVSMPYPAGSPKMPQCQIDQVRIWVEGGGLND